MSSGLVPRDSACSPVGGNAGATGLRILIVEDDQDTADTMRELLALDGHQVEAVYDAPAALHACDAQRPDVILCDLAMPGMDGLQLARTLRRDPGHRSTRLIAVTGFGHADIRRETHAAGFDAHLVKPVEMEELQRHLWSLT